MTQFKAPSVVLLSLLGLPLLPVQESGETYRVKFAPAAGASVTKTISSITTLESDEISFAINGDEDAFPPMQTTTEIEQSMVIADRYDVTRDGVPIVLSRTFGELNRTFNMAVDIGPQTATPKGEGKSALTDSTVTFTYDPQSGCYETEFAGDEPRGAELLDGLIENMDMRGLLPLKALEVGEVYEIDPAAFKDLLHAGGDFAFEMKVEGTPGAAGVEPYQMTDYRSFFRQIKEAKASGKLADVVQVDGESIAVIELSLSMVGVADHSDSYEAKSNEGRPADARSVVNAFELELDCDGEGELRWSLDRSVLDTLDFTGHLELGATLDVVSRRPNRETKMELTSSQSGDVTITVRTE